MNELFITGGPVPDLEKAKLLLTQEAYTCVICRGDEQFSSRERGIRPLLNWVLEGKDFSGFSAADRVVGKAAALLYARLGIRRLYTGMLSEKALPVLEAYHIRTQADCTVPYIRNRQGDGCCPMEETVWNIQDPDEAVPALQKKLKALH